MQGYTYGESQPTENCPYCGAECGADFCDVGVGYSQVGPYHCTRCHASQISPYQYDFDNLGTLGARKLRDGRVLSAAEQETGWYEPDSDPDSLANVDKDGNIIGYRQADALYRAKHGLWPR